MFQITLFRVLDHNLKKLKEVLNAFHLRKDLAVFDHLMLPCSSSYKNPLIIDWDVCVLCCSHVENFGIII